MGSLNSFSGSSKEWVDNISPTLWYKLQILSKGEVWILEDAEFHSLVDQLAVRVIEDEGFLEDIMMDDRFPLLVQVLAYMHTGLVLRFCAIAPQDLLFERNLIRWCIDNLGDNQFHPACKVLVARFDWLIQQDLNNRLFGKYTRKKIQKILSTMP